MIISTRLHVEMQAVKEESATRKRDQQSSGRHGFESRQLPRGTLPLQLAPVGRVLGHLLDVPFL